MVGDVCEVDCIVVQCWYEVSRYIHSRMFPKGQSSLPREWGRWRLFCVIVTCELSAAYRSYTLAPFAIQYYLGSINDIYE